VSIPWVERIIKLLHLHVQVLQPNPAVPSRPSNHGIRINRSQTLSDGTGSLKDQAGAHPIPRFVK
jgi:hypothetical protein